MSTPTSETERKQLLPSEVIIMKIVSKVPVKSVLRFHCVSKEWFDNLREEYFRNLHSDILLRSRSLSQSSPTLLFSTLQWEATGDPAGQGKLRRIITIKSPESTSHFVIRTMAIKGNEDGSLSGCKLIYETIHCNGLLCMVGKWGAMSGRRWPIIVCNPLTLEYLALPPCTGALVYTSCFGLGFAPLSKQYKVVCIHPREGAPSWSQNFCPDLTSFLGVMKVYTLGEDTTWRVVDLHIDLYLRITYRPVHLYADGKIYWMTSGPGPHECRLVSFDVQSEQAIIVGNLPPTFLGHHRHGFKLAHLGGRVSLFMNTGEVLDVWMLKEGCSSSSNDYSWDLRQSVRLPCILTYPHSICQLEGIWESSDGDLITVFEQWSSGFFCYGQISSSRRDHAQFSGLKGYKDSWLPCSGYKPSLVSLKRYGCSVGAMVVDSRFSSPPKI